MTENRGLELCKHTPSWDLLRRSIRIEEGKGLDYARAKRLADQEAAKASSEPMLLAWYDAKEGKFSPGVECCCHTNKKPSWLIYAETRGGEIQVVINDLEYVFVYRP
ncbi:MAG: AF1514 family protein [Syntrophobacteraceae bacterium]|nr:AF1514 family protein [Syntrophobacteraceae bacterium]